MTWGAFALDQFVAPKCSELTKCLAPELSEVPEYFRSFFLNNVLIKASPDKGRSLAIVFLRRLTNAARAYRNGRDEMQRCVDAPKHSNEMVIAYLNSLSHFESAIWNANLALQAHDALGKLFGIPCSKADNLREAYDALRHFQDRVENWPHTGKFATPVWLVDDGVEFVGGRERGAKVAKLCFEELTEILRDLERDARVLAEDIFKAIPPREGE
jgi:hypothetical protein